MKNNTLIGTKWGKANINNKGYYDIVSAKEGNFKKKCHRLIYEDYYNVCLLPFVDIHHIDGDKLNNSINNLEPLYHGEHSHLHNLGENNAMFGTHWKPEAYFNKSSKNGLPFRVSKSKAKHSKKGFYYKYQYFDEGKRKSLRDISIFKLRDKVINKGLTWNWLNYDASTDEN